MTPPIQLQRLPRRKKPARQRASLLLGLALALLLIIFVISGCSQAGAQEPQPTAQEQRIARGAVLACGGGTPIWADGFHTCAKERP